MRFMIWVLVMKMLEDTVQCVSFVVAAWAPTVLDFQVDLDQDDYSLK